MTTFIDSNVLVYSNDPASDVKHAQAGIHLARLWRDGSGALSMQVLQESYVNLTRKIPNVLAPHDARKVISAYATWPLHRPDADAILEAAQVAERHRISFWDALIVVSARAMGAEVLLTEDLSNGQVIEGVRVVDPFLADADPAPVSDRGRPPRGARWHRRA